MSVKVVESKWLNNHVYVTHVVISATSKWPEVELQNFYDYKNLVTNCINLSKGKTFETKQMILQNSTLMTMRKNNWRDITNGAPEEELKPVSHLAQQKYTEYLNKVMLDEDAAT